MRYDDEQQYLHEQEMQRQYEQEMHERQREEQREFALHQIESIQQQIDEHRGIIEVLESHIQEILSSMP